MDETRLPFAEHLEELRRRILWCVVALGAGLAVTWPFHRTILGFLISPLAEVLPPDGGLVILSVQEGFIASFKMSFWVALLLSSPVIFYHAWAFVAPGLYDREKGYAVPFVAASTLLFLGGA
ncbi:MAG: twin-arginine translocase subunit TatC, partial [Vicinamibacteria bacterium]